MIEVEAVNKTFGTDVVALEGINLTIEEGEFISLIGPSGCGKTTLLRLIAGLEKATQGVLQIDGHDPMEARKRHEIGVAFQRPALVASRTAIKNVELTTEVTGNSNALSPKKLLSDFGLKDFLDHYPHQLSGGMQQRVNIACALVHNPRLLLLDEPFGALDELTRETMVLWLKDILKKSKQTAVLVTHSIDEAVTLSDRVVVLSPRPGRIDQIISIDLKEEQMDHADPEYQRYLNLLRDALKALHNPG